MNPKKLLSLVAALTAVSAYAADPQVEVSDLPAAVQRTLESARAGSPVKQVVRRTVDGRNIYVAEIDKDNALNPRIRISEDGSLLPPSDFGPTPGIGGAPMLDPAGGVAVPVFPKPQMEDLPEAVRKTALAEAHGREIADIDRETWNRQPVFEIEFKEKGLNSRIYVDPSGTIVRDEPGRSLKSLFMGTQLEDTPAAVQETIRRVARDGEISDIDRKTKDGRSIYRVEIKNEQSVREIHVAEDGAILFDSRSSDHDSTG